MTHDTSQGMEKFQVMAFIIQYSHTNQSASDTWGAAGTVLVELRQSTLNCSSVNAVCSLNHILSFRNVFSVLSGQLCLNTCLDLLH